MNGPHIRQHLSAEALQALLEGDLPLGERGRVEEHLASCARCSAELEAFRTLFHELEELPPLTPSAGFADRVMAGVDHPAAVPLAARVRALLGGRSAEEHVSGERLQDFLGGALPARQAARIRTHLDACPACAGEAASWRATFARLDALERLAPAEDFADRVMARVRVPAPAPAPVPEWRKALAWAGRLVPQTRKAWATVSGVALTPAVTLGLVLWTLFSHPTLTAGALASFAWWKASELAGFLWQTASAAVLESAGLFDMYSLVASLAVSPAAVAGVFAVLSLGTVAATWVLYRNLFAPHPVDGRYTHAPLS